MTLFSHQQKQTLLHYFPVIKEVFLLESCFETICFVKMHYKLRSVLLFRLDVLGS